MIDLDAIINAAAREFGTTGNAVLTADDTQISARLARQVSVYLARHVAGLSWGDIGEYFDRRDRGVMHAVWRIKQLMARDATFADRVTRIRDTLIQETSGEEACPMLPLEPKPVKPRLAARAAGRPARRCVKRSCLKCGGMFRSDGPGNRICDPCQQVNNRFNRQWEGLVS